MMLKILADFEPRAEVVLLELDVQMLKNFK